jgi:transposase
VALAHSLNANMLRKWVIDAENSLSAKSKKAPAEVIEDVAMPAPTFVPLALPAPTVEGEIRIELQRGGTATSSPSRSRSSSGCATASRASS